MAGDYAKFSTFEVDWPADRVLRLTLNNPATMNSLDQTGHNHMTYIWNEIDADPDVSAVILTGKGKAFSAGGDFGMIEAMIDDYQARVRSWKEAKDLVYNIINCGKPIVSAINGVAVGAGLVAGLLSDISIAAKSAKIVATPRTPAARPPHPWLTPRRGPRASRRVRPTRPATRDDRPPQRVV